MKALINAADEHFNSYIEKLLPTSVEKEMEIIGMKILGRDRNFDHGGGYPDDEGSYELCPVALHQYHHR